MHQFNPATAASQRQSEHQTASYSSHASQKMSVF